MGLTDMNSWARGQWPWVHAEPWTGALLRDSARGTRTTWLRRQAAGAQVLAPTSCASVLPPHPREHDTPRLAGPL